MSKLGRRKKRRAHSPHRGVKILQRRRASGFVYIGRWRDPIADAWREISLTSEGYKTAEACRAWAIRKAHEIAKVKERGAGAVMRLDKAIQHYFEVQQDLRENTRNAYRYALDHFSIWAAREGIVLCYQLTPGHLAQLHGYVKSLKKRTPQKNTDVGSPVRLPKGKKGVGRGAHKPSPDLLSAASRNQILRGCHTFLNFIRRLDLTPLITSDDIKDRLPYVRGESSPVSFLHVSQIKLLLEAAQRHDDEKFKITREEHDGMREPGTTARFPAVRPFILACLLTGGRFAEVACLRWDECDLDVGEIRLDAKRVKTKIGRVIRLKTSPLLWRLLSAIKLQAAGNTHVFNCSRWNKEQRKWELTPTMLRDVAETARARLISKFAAPKFTWHDLRRTAGTFLANMAGANLKHVADYLGHSIAMAEKLYWGAVDVDPGATTLEQAMEIAPIQAQLAPAKSFSETS